MSGSSCFIDAVEIAFGVRSEVLAQEYRALVSGDKDHDPDEHGYHPSIVNQILLERFGRAMTEIDLVPTHVYQDSVITLNGPTENVVSWFRRPEFACVAVGLRNSNYQPHANAFVNGRFHEPSTKEPLEEPNIQLQSIWLVGLPRAAE